MGMYRTYFSRTFKKDSPFYGQTWTHDTGPMPADWMAEHAKLSTRFQYAASNGWNQYITDGTSSVKSRVDWVAKLDKNRANILAGTVASTGGQVVVVQSPLEVEILRLATEKVETRIAEKLKANPHTYTKPTATEKSDFIQLLITTSYAKLADEAQTNLDALSGVEKVASADIQAAFADLMSDAPAEKKSAKK